MSLSKKTKNAIMTNDLKTIDKIVDQLRFYFSYNHKDVCEYFKKTSNITDTEFENLMGELDEYNSF